MLSEAQLQTVSHAFPNSFIFGHSKKKKGEGWHSTLTYFPLQLLHIKYNPRQHQEECLTHWETIWHLQSLSIHQIVIHWSCTCSDYSENPSLLLFSSAPWTREVKGLQKLASQQHYQSKYPDHRRFSRSPTLPNTSELCTLKASDKSSEQSTP